MPRGKYVNHKGRSRHFTSPEEMEEEMKKKHRSKDGGSDEESEEEAGSGSNEDSEEESDEDHKAKGVESLIEIENPNRAPRKSAQKVTAVTVDKAAKPELTRREREEIEKQRAQAHYQKLHAEGKTEQARADLARLAIIKQHRAEAAARREAEKKAKEEKTKKPSTSK